MMTDQGIIKHICVSEKKGIRKERVEKAEFVSKYGILGDAHAGQWHRQISILSEEDVTSMKNKGLHHLQPGAFAENLVLDGLNLTEIGLGTRIQLGKDVVISITQIGKECHSRCNIFQLTGDCIMPRLGLFARVIENGTISVNDLVSIQTLVPRSKFQCVVLTISDRCFRNETIDTAGPAVSKLIQNHLNAHIYKTAIIPDEKDIIKNKLCHYSDGHSIDFIVTVGGTGFSPRDVTPEATREVADRLTPGLDETMRRTSIQHTPHAMFSRGVSGIRKSTLIINIPGSENAALENLRAILPALEHGLLKMKGDSSDCGRPIL